MVNKKKKKIEKLKFIEGFPHNFVGDEISGGYSLENKEGIIVRKINEIIDKLNEK